MIPVHLEQLAMTRKAVATGAGVGANASQPHSITEAMRKIRTEQQYRLAAQRLADKYRSVPSLKLINLIADRIESLATR